MKPLQYELRITIQVLPRPSVKTMTDKPEMTSTLFLNATQVAAVKNDPSNVFAILDNITHYQPELQILCDLHAEVESCQKDNSDYA
jgi:hypothetical protein